MINSLALTVYKKVLKEAWKKPDAKKLINIYNSIIKNWSLAIILWIEKGQSINFDEKLNDECKYTINWVRNIIYARLALKEA